MVNYRPVINNPALRLLTKPTRVKDDVTGGRKLGDVDGKSRLHQCQTAALEQIEALIKSFDRLPKFGNNTLIWLRLYQDASAPSHTPADLCRVTECQIVAPWRSGCVLEVSKRGLQHLAERIRKLPSLQTKIDVANLSGIKSCIGHSSRDGRTT